MILSTTHLPGIITITFLLVPEPRKIIFDILGINDIQRCGCGYHSGGLGANASCTEGIVQDCNITELLEHGFSR